VNNTVGIPLVAWCANVPITVPETVNPSVCATGNGLLELTAVPPLNKVSPVSITKAFR